MTPEQQQALAQIAEAVSVAQQLTQQAREQVYAVGMTAQTTARARLAITAAADNLVIAAKELQEVTNGNN